MRPVSTLATPSYRYVFACLHDLPDIQPDSISMSWLETRASRLLRIRCRRIDDGAYIPTHAVSVGPALCDLQPWAVWAVYEAEQSHHPIQWGPLGRRVPPGTRFVLPTDEFRFGLPPVARNLSARGAARS